MNIEELDIKLMGEYTIESMLGGGNSAEDVEFSYNPNIRALQIQAPEWSTRVKGFLLSPKVEQTSVQSQFVTAIKDSMLADFSLNKAMSYLYNEKDIDILVQQISMLAMHAQYKNVDDIFNIDNDTIRMSLNPESVSVAIGIYTYFTLLVNRKISSDIFNKLFIKAFCNYYNNWEARRIMFQMNGNSWKSSFSGVLLD